MAARLTDKQKKKIVLIIKYKIKKKIKKKKK